MQQALGRLIEEVGVERRERYIPLLNSLYIRAISCAVQTGTYEAVLLEMPLIFLLDEVDVAR